MARFRPAFIVFSGLLMLAGCATLNDKDHLYRGDSLRVSLVPSGQAGNDLSHPTTIEAGQLSRVLSALSFEEHATLLRSGGQPIFTRDEVDELAPRLADGLAEAGPDQRVSFLTYGRSGSIIGNARKTEGTVFVDRQGQLNIAFAGIQQLMTVDDDFTRYREFSLGDPLNADDTFIRLVTTPETISPRTRGHGETWPMWVTVSLDGSAIAASPESAPIPASAPERARGPRVSEAPERTPPSTSPAATAPVDRDDSGYQPEDIRERLQFLKSLHEDGLITDEDYDRERQRLLQRID